MRSIRDRAHQVIIVVKRTNVMNTNGTVTESFEIQVEVELVGVRVAVAAPAMNEEVVREIGIDIAEVAAAKETEDGLEIETEGMTQHLKLKSF